MNDLFSSSAMTSSTPLLTPYTGPVAAFGRVAVLMGGWSAERQVSLWSGQGVVEALQAAGVDAVAVDVRAATDLFGLKTAGFTRAFSTLHGTGGEDGTAQAILDAQGLAYPGCGVLAAALSMDKLRTKRLWRAAGLPTADFLEAHARPDLDAAAETYGYPFIVKPAADGSSVGVTKVKNPGQLDAAWTAALGATGDNVVMAERFVPGREFSIPVVGGGALPIVEIRFDGEFYDYEAKYISNSTRYLCPADVPEDVAATIRAEAVRALAAIAGRHWARLDFLMGDDHRHQWLEANTLPGMTSHSLVPLAAAAAGLDYSQLCLKLLSFTLPGHAGRTAP